MLHRFLPHTFLLAVLLTILASCGSGSDDYTAVPVSPVEIDLTTVPYDSLSKYKFFEGDLKNLQPAYGVLPYDLNSQLFTDYALKKRFVWMPAGTHATYTADGEILNFPTGAALIKTFYYESITTGGEDDIVETRIMIKKDTGWIFAEYVWNADKTEAILDMAGSVRRVGWLVDGVVTGTNYKIPTGMQCINCHSTSSTPIPIGPKPQNLNKIYNYADGAKNQLKKWKAFGYLDTAPANVVSTIDWTDTTQPLELRVRSYLDINCAHCHTEGGFNNHSPMNLAFGKTTIPANLGMCTEPTDFVTGDQQYIIAKQDAEGSLMPYRMSTNIQSEMMPLIGRTVVHTEALQLIQDWINAMEEPCP